MALNIKSKETDRLARTLAEATGESLTVAVTRALEERLARVSAQSAVERRRTLLREIVERSRHIPVIDPRPIDEILGYDEKGLFG